MGVRPTCRRPWRQAPRETARVPGTGAPSAARPLVGEAAEAAARAMWAGGQSSRGGRRPRGHHGAGLPRRCCTQRGRAGPRQPRWHGLPGVRSRWPLSLGDRRLAVRAGATGCSGRMNPRGVPDPRHRPRSRDRRRRRRLRPAKAAACTGGTRAAPRSRLRTRRGRRCGGAGRRTQAAARHGHAPGASRAGTGRGAGRGDTRASRDRAARARGRAARTAAITAVPLAEHARQGPAEPALPRHDRRADVGGDRGHASRRRPRRRADAGPG